MSTGHWGRSCKGKQRHASKGAADAHVRALLKLGKCDAQTESYSCRYCGSWHVGRKPLKGR